MGCVLAGQFVSCTFALCPYRCSVVHLAIVSQCKSRLWCGTQSIRLVLHRVLSTLSHVLSCSLGQAPAKPRTPLGEMMSYYLSMEPHLFRDTLDAQFARLKEEKEARERQIEEKEKLGESAPMQAETADLVLYRYLDTTPPYY